MSDELESELERLKNEKIVSEATAKIYLSKLREKLEQDDVLNESNKNLK